MSFLRFLMLLSLIVWVGGLDIFSGGGADCLLGAATRHLAGLVVGHSLGILHWMGIVSGLVFLASSLLYSRLRQAGRMFSRRAIFWSA